MTQTLTKVRFGHSPDPDDAFMFYAFEHRKIPMNGFEVVHVVEDIESLNKRALLGGLEVTAVSVHAYAKIADRYAILRSGASMGDGYGPILVAMENSFQGTDYSLSPENGHAQSPACDRVSFNEKTIAVPGEMTSAFLALKLFAADFKHVVIPFDQIIDFVKAGKADAGLLIHEGQLTFADERLRKIADLGIWWREMTGLPLPLGVDVIRKNLGVVKMKSFSNLFRASIAYSLAHRAAALDYAMPFGRGLSREKGDRFVGMYVNDLTVDLDERGEQAIREFLKRGFEAGLLSELVEPEFV